MYIYTAYMLIYRLINIKDNDNLLLQTNLLFNNKWLNKIVKLTFDNSQMMTSNGLLALQ